MTPPRSRRRPLDGAALFAASADAVFVTDERDRVVLWNAAAERLLGVSAAHALGRACDAALAGAEVRDRRAARRLSELGALARRGGAVCECEVLLRRRSGPPVRATVAVVAVRGEEAGRFATIHLVRTHEPDGARDGPSPARANGAARRGGAAVHAGGAGAEHLTPREREILGRLGEGASTKEIARALRISVATVRTHVQHLLRKLGAHTRLEAVTRAPGDEWP